MAIRESGLIPITGLPWQGVCYGCTTRHGGVSAGPWASLNLGLHTGDDECAVHENRRRLAAALPGEPFWLQQVHGIHVVEAGSTVLPPRADAAFTTQPGCVLAIMTADCAPVVIADTHGRVLGVAHAGWRGLVAGVLDSTLAALRARLPSAAGWRAWVGPCIGQAGFEVGDEVRLAFTGADPAAAAFFVTGVRPGKWQADLAGLVCHRLAALGVQNVEVSGLCTFGRADLFHSYRRAAVTGRMATVAWLEPCTSAA